MLFFDSFQGNPHFFAEHGFAGKDPHAFHVVGGTFLNSGEGISSLAPPPPTSKLQPLFRNTTSEGNEDDDELQPFFSDQGATPWGDVVSGANEARTIPAAPPVSSTRTKAAKSQKQHPQQSEAHHPPGFSDSTDGTFFTDAEITKRSQAAKTGQSMNLDAHDPCASLQKLQQAHLAHYEADMEFVRQWVANLPKPRPTPHFGEFKLDADAIMEKATASL